MPAPASAPAPAPAFTVVVTTYNRADLMPRAVASVLAQTCTDFELIVVDDGSTDATPAVLEHLAADPRVQVLRLPNSGVSRARNAGVAAGTGEWIAILDDDNEWYPTYLEHQLAVATSRPDAGVVYCSAEQYERDGRLVWIWPDTSHPDDAFAALVDRWFTWMSASIFRRDLFEAIGGFDPALDTREDKDLFLALAVRTQFAGTADALMIRRLHGQPRLTDHTVSIMRTGFVLDRKWHRTIIERCGRVAYARYFHRQIGRQTVRALLLAPESEARALAAEARTALVARLPWSATTLPVPMLIGAMGLARYQRLRANYGRTARALRVRGREPTR